MAVFLASRLRSRSLVQTLTKITTTNLTKRYISTSNKSKDTATIAEPVIGKGSVTEASEKPKKSNWITYGFSRTDEISDRFYMHLIFFMGWSVCIVGGAFILAYMPDVREMDWTHRQGYLELRRRESLGLPLIDRDYVDPSTIELPSDEELGDFEIII